MFKKLKIIVPYVIACIIGEFVRIIDGKWFLLGFVLLLAWIISASICETLKHKEKKLTNETTNSENLK